MEKNVTPDRARELLLSLPFEQNTETINVTQAQGRVIAADFVAEIPSPPFVRSAFDGYAFAASDVIDASRDNPVTLSIDQEIAAGQTSSCDVVSGHAAKILTGAPIPTGADAVVKFELTKFDDKQVTIFSPLDSGENIVLPGEDYSVGTTLLAKGSILTPAMLGVIAGQGKSEIAVYVKPRIKIISTGSELSPPGKPLEPAMIYNSSMYSLGGYLSAVGTEFVDGGVVADEPDVIVAAIREALPDCDMLITTGGAATGDYDFAYTTAEMLGGNALFWKAAMRPGGAILAYTLNGKLVLSLSGNPGAAALGLLHLALPYIKKLCGRSDVDSEVCQVKLKESLLKKNPVTRLIRGRLAVEDGDAYFEAEGNQRGGDLSSLINCDLIAEIPTGTSPLEAGSLVTAYRIGI